MKTLTFLATVTAVAPFACLAQTADDLNAGMRIEHDESTGANTISWWGKENHVYVLQTSDPQLMNWTYIDDHIFVGEGAVEDSFNFTMSGEPKRAFFKLHYSEAPVSDPANVGDLDIDGDGLSIQVEIENNTNPFSALDLSGNGIADEVDALWASVPSTWIDTIVNDSNSDYYDPEATISSASDVSPVDDYDGDGLSNLQEYLVGSSPTDYFNGETPHVRIRSGYGQTGAPDEFLDQTFLVKVERPDGSDYLNAPVRYSITGHQGLALVRDENELTASITSRTGREGAKAYFFTPSSLGESYITASAPVGNIVTISVTTVSAALAAKTPIRDFKRTDHSDGTSTYTWISEADQGDWFKINRRNQDGSYYTIYETTYGSSELPYVSGVNTYSIKLDENHDAVVN